MKFKVSSKVKGSLILKTIGRPLSAGSSVFLEGHSVYENDVQRAIKAGLLEALTENDKIEIKNEIINKTVEVVIINKTDKVVIIGNMPIRPNGSAIKNIKDLDLNAIKASIDKGLIQVITDIDEEIFKRSPVSKKETIANNDIIENDIMEEKPILEKGIEILEETISDDINPEEELSQLIEESEEITPKTLTWDFRTQKNVEPQIVPRSGQKIIGLEEDDVENVNMIDSTIEELDNAKNIEKDKIDIDGKINNIKKKLSQSTAKKKSTNKKDISKIKQNFIEGSEEIAIALDSMGRPLKNDMNHMVSSPDKEDVLFVDKVQIQKGTNNGFNIDLD